MRRYIPFLALGLGAYLAFVLSQFPAATALRWFAPPDVRTSNVSGTIWSGSAQFASINDLALGDLRWEINALPLLLARLAGSAQARLSTGFADTQFSVSRSQLRFSELQLSTALGALTSMLPVSGASGALSAQFATLELERIRTQINSQQVELFWPIQALGNVRVSDLIVEPYAGLGNELIPLGSYELNFSESSESAIQAQIQDLGGPLEFNGTFSVTPTRDYKLEGQILTRPDASQSLEQGLGFMAGEPGPDGRRALALSGSL